MPSVIEQEVLVFWLSSFLHHLARSRQEPTRLPVLENSKHKVLTPRPSRMGLMTGALRGIVTPEG